MFSVDLKATAITCTEQATVLIVNDIWQPACCKIQRLIDQIDSMPWWDLLINSSMYTQYMLSSKVDKTEFPKKFLPTGAHKTFESTKLELAIKN